jgi:hypothetical protein
MAITKWLDDPEVIQGLSDKPNEIEGLTADQLKKKFDDNAINLKAYINETLTDELDTALTLASQAEAIAGTENTKIMTALRTRESIDANNSSVATSITNLNDGWRAVTAGTYASATTITVASGAALIYKKGDKLKLTQTTVKYFYVVTVADTLLTITGGTSFTLANAVITDMFVSHQANPIGFPQWFNYIPVLTGSVSNPVLGSSTIAGKFTIQGELVTCSGIYLVTTGGTFNAGSGTYYVSLPTAGDDTAPSMNMGTLFDAGTEDFVLRCRVFTGNKIIFGLAKNGFGLSHNSPVAVWATGDYIIFNLTYKLG